MNIQCMNCEFDNQCIDCMYNKKQMENDIKNENRGEPIHLNKKRIERIERNKQKKTDDMRLYKRLKKREARQRELSEEFPFLYGNTQDNPYHTRTARFD